MTTPYPARPPLVNPALASRPLRSLHAVTGLLALSLLAAACTSSDTPDTNTAIQASQSQIQANQRADQDRASRSGRRPLRIAQTFTVTAQEEKALTFAYQNDFRRALATKAIADAKAKAAAVAKAKAKAKADAQAAQAKAAAAAKVKAEADARAAKTKAAASARKKASLTASRPTPNQAASYGQAVSSSNNTPDQNRALARQLMLARGFADDQWDCLNKLWTKESRFEHAIVNPSSGAGGIPQALPASKMGAGWQDNPAQQIRWGLDYLKSRYGSPCGGWSASQSKGWY